MSELERARENLLHHQTRLHLARNNGYSSEVEAYEAAQFLAALSWVWDAQERREQELDRRTIIAYEHRRRADAQAA